MFGRPPNENEQPGAGTTQIPLSCRLTLPIRQCSGTTGVSHWGPFASMLRRFFVSLLARLARLLARFPSARSSQSHPPSVPQPMTLRQQKLRRVRLPAPPTTGTASMPVANWAMLGANRTGPRASPGRQISPAVSASHNRSTSSVNPAASSVACRPATTTCCPTGLSSALRSMRHSRAFRICPASPSAVYRI